MFTSFSDHRSKSCITSAGRGGFVKFKLLGELLFATFDKGVFGVRPMWASIGEIFVTLCGVILSVLIIFATSEASLCGLFVLSILMTANLRFKVCIILSTTHIAL